MLALGRRRAGAVAAWSSWSSDRRSSWTTGRAGSEVELALRLARSRAAGLNMEQWLSVQGYLLLACVAAAVVLLMLRSATGTVGGGSILSCMPQLLPSCSRAVYCRMLGACCNRHTRHREFPPNLEKAGESDEDMTVIWLHPLAHENWCSSWNCPSWSPLKTCPCETQQAEMHLHRLLPRARFVSPSADASAISADDLTPCSGLPLRTWFDIYGRTPATGYDERGIELAVERVRVLQYLCTTV